MASITSILSASYKSNVLNVARSNSRYVAVDPELYQGSWSGKYANNKSFTVTVSDVSGFRAKVRYQSDGVSTRASFRAQAAQSILGGGKAMISSI